MLPTTFFCPPLLLEICFDTSGTAVTCRPFSGIDTSGGTYRSSRGNNEFSLGLGKIHLPLCMHTCRLRGRSIFLSTRHRSTLHLPPPHIPPALSLESLKALKPESPRHEASTLKPKPKPKVTPLEPSLHFVFLFHLITHLFHWCSTAAHRPQ